MSRLAAYSWAGFAALVGWGSQIAFGFFLFAGPPSIVDTGLGRSEPLLLDAALSLLFFAQHSGMVRRPFHQWLARFIPEEFGNAFYGIASGAALFAVVIFWQETVPIFTASGISRWALRTLFCLSLLGFAWGIKSLESFDPCGCRQILSRRRGIGCDQMPFIVKGPYRWVRHPLYLFSITTIWSCPDLTVDRLLFNLLWTAWIVAGAFMEERDLIAQFGETYREYQRNVPMLIPAGIRPARSI